MKHNILFIAIFSLITNNLISQNINDELGLAYAVRDYATMTKLNNPDSGKLITTYFLYDEWQDNCTVIIKGKRLKLSKVNFKIATSEFLLNEGKNSAFSFNTRNIDLITIDARRFKYRMYNGKNKFFEILHENKKGLSFLRGYSIRILPKSNIGALNRPYDVKKREVKLFILKGEKLSVIKLKKKKILKLLDKKKHSQVLEYVKKNKFSFKNESDLIKILNYYNNL